MSLPATYNFPDHYNEDGLSEFTLTLTDSNGTAVNLTGSSVKMKLVMPGKTGYTFDNVSGGITILSNGVLRFNKINSWTLDVGTYKYDLQVTDSTGFVRTYLKGTWNVIGDITR